MRQTVKTILGLWFAAGLLHQAHAFSLMGPYATDWGFLWQTAPLGYNLGGDVGGVMNLGQEYRWNIHTVYYGFDASFLNFFGERGVEEVDKAVKFLNDLPAASEINLDDYPLTTVRANHQAGALTLLDLKSTTMQLLLEEMGLTYPQRYVFTLRKRYVNPVTNYVVIKRNFDPVTWQHSSYINGDLWTYGGMFDNQDVPAAFPINVRVDPLAYGEPVSVANDQFISFNFGDYYTGLTRDDVGGLKYIYRRLNRNVETATPSASGGLGGVVVPSGGGGIGGGSPWNAVLRPSTNAVGGTNAAVVPVGTNAFVNPALRSGVDKVRFVKVNYDSLLGQTIDPIVDSWLDEFVTNNAPRVQVLQRAVIQPDLLFAGQDITGPPDGPGNAFAFSVRTDTTGWVNDWALNSPAPANAGPGTIQPPISIIYNTVGPRFYHIWPFNLSEQGALIVGWWASFDGTTNAPVVYPSNVSIEDVERQVLGGR
jgi:hypothetical protein